MPFHEKIMQLRKEKGWSQEEFGNQLNVSRQTVSKWELAQTTPEMSKLMEMSQLFDVSLDELVNNKQAAKQREEYVLVTHYEYKSKKSIFGLPLVHINLGRGFHRAKGIIAIGNVATGIISIGLLSIGIVSIGAFLLGILAMASIALGGIAFGGISMGLVAIGGITIGVLSIGGLCIGMYSIGGCAVASNIALGDYANAHIAIGNTVNGTVELLRDNTNAKEIEQAIVREFPNTWKLIIKLFTQVK